VHQQACKM